MYSPFYCFFYCVFALDRIQSCWDQPLTQTVFSVYADIHTEAVQAALAKHKEEKMALPMPTKRRSTYVQSPIETRTPPGKTGKRDSPTH